VTRVAGEQYQPTEANDVSHVRSPFLFLPNAPGERFSISPQWGVQLFGPFFSEPFDDTAAMLANGQSLTQVAELLIVRWSSSQPFRVPRNETAFLYTLLVHRNAVVFFAPAEIAPNQRYSIIRLLKSISSKSLLGSS
jgi:hypothetical protein